MIRCKYKIQKGLPRLMEEIKIESLYYRLFNSEGRLVVLYEEDDKYQSIKVNQYLLYDESQTFTTEGILINGERIGNERIQDILVPVHIDDDKPCIEFVIDTPSSKDMLYIHAPLSVGEDDERQDAPYYMIEKNDDTSKDDDISKDADTSKDDDALKMTFDMNIFRRHKGRHRYIEALEDIKSRRHRILPFIKESFNYASVFSLIPLFLYIQLFFATLGWSVDGITFMLHQSTNHHTFSDLLSIIAGVFAGYVIYNRLVTRLCIELIGYVDKRINQLDNKIESTTLGYLNEDAIQVQKLNELNRIVEFEKEPHVAHRLYEYIDLEQSTSSKLTIDYTSMGRIAEQVNAQGDTHLTPKQQAMVNHVISDVLDMKDIEKIQSVIHNYHQTRENIEYQREYNKYDKLFSENQYESENRFVEEFDKITDKLNQYYQEMENLKQEKMKDTDEKIS